MTFTLSLTLPLAEITKVRLAIGDVNAEAPMVSDELITAQIATTGGWQEAAVACLRTVIAEMSATPNFTADWLRVDTATGIAALNDLLSALKVEFGLETTLSSTSVQAVTWTDDAEDA